jgi:hypothetical protein
MRVSIFFLVTFVALSCVAHATEPFWNMPDSDGDGILNSIECPRIVELGDPLLCADTDHDTVPNILDDDSDNDGLLDGNDNNPLVAAHRSARSIDELPARTEDVATVTLTGILVGCLGVLIYVRNRTL